MCITRAQASLRGSIERGAILWWHANPAMGMRATRTCFLCTWRLVWGFRRTSRRAKPWMMLLTGARIHRPCKLYGAEDAMLRRRRPPSGVRKEVVGYSARLGPGLPYPGPYLLALI